MNNTQETLVIRPSWSNKKRKRYILIAILALILLTTSTYFFGYFKGLKDVEGNALWIADLQKNVSELRKSEKELQNKVARLKTNDSVQKTAYKELEKTYEQVDQKNEFLNRRINFYRSMVSPKDGISGVRIHSFKLLESNVKNKVDFEITLIQSITHSSKANVEVMVELYRSKDSASPELVWSHSSNDYSFRYYEIVKGALNYSDGEVDGKFIKLTVTPDGDKNKQLVEWRKV